MGNARCEGREILVQNGTKDVFARALIILFPAPRRHQMSIRGFEIVRSQHADEMLNTLHELAAGAGGIVPAGLR